MQKFFVSLVFEDLFQLKRMTLFDVLQLSIAFTH